MELREDETTGDVEMWANLGDILTWLDSLPSFTVNRIPAEFSHEIRQMLYDAAVTPSEVPRGQVPTTA